MSEHSNTADQDPTKGQDQKESQAPETGSAPDAQPSKVVDDPSPTADR